MWKYNGPSDVSRIGAVELTDAETEKKVRPLALLSALDAPIFFPPIAPFAKDNPLPVVSTFDSLFECCFIYVSLVLRIIIVSFIRRTMSSTTAIHRFLKVEILVETLPSHLTPLTTWLRPRSMMPL